MALPRLFISHASTDSDIAERLAVKLREHSLDVWLDASHLGPGNFMQRIDEALATRDVLILLLSPESLHSEWVKDEVYAALHRLKNKLMREPIVITIKAVEEADIPPSWAVLNRIHATHKIEDSLPQVLKSLGISSSTPKLNSSLACLSLISSKKTIKRYELGQGISFLYFDRERNIQVTNNLSQVNTSIGYLRFHIEVDKPAVFALLKHTSEVFLPFVITVLLNGRTCNFTTQERLESRTLNEHDEIHITIQSTLGIGIGVPIAEAKLRYNRIFI